MDTGPRAADRAPAGRILGRLMHQLGRFCMSINPPAGPGFMHQLRPDRWQLIHQLGARIAGNSTSWAGRWARIAANCAPQLRHASRIAGRWAVGLGQNARAAGGLDLREIEQTK